MSKRNTCAFDGCDRPVHGKGLCKTHGQQLRVRGWVGPIATEPRPLEDRFWEKVSKTESCWIWEATLTRKGYGMVSVEGKARQAHRVSWSLANGPIPNGMLVDHICHNHACVNPEHLRLASAKSNSEYRKGPQKGTLSGCRNVYKTGARWSVYIYHNGKNLYFGRYSTVEEADKVAKAERSRLFQFPDYEG